jgi:dipeptidyl aminopeptidase/acylaminoacyl peptidase
MYEAVVVIDTETGSVELIKQANRQPVDPDYISVPRLIEFPTEDALTAYGYFYPPVNPDHRAPDGELPPLLVWCHGGPTAMASPTIRLGTQYWTSRGFAVLDLDYGGSWGYGRAYRQRLNGRWGIVDVDDSVNGARFLAEQGLVDPARLAIRGASAGGYTTLCALTFRDVFATGASHFGVGDLAGLAAQTHKYESRYLDLLVGPYPQASAVYEERSPVHHSDKMNRPVIFFQGLDDKVVPVNQAETMVAALAAKGVPVAYLPFEGEGHGFRKAANIGRAMEAELYFYGRVLGFTPAGEIAAIEITNL